MLTEPARADLGVDGIQAHIVAHLAQILRVLAEGAADRRVPREITDQRGQELAQCRVCAEDVADARGSAEGHRRELAAMVVGQASRPGGDLGGERTAHKRAVVLETRRRQDLGQARHAGRDRRLALADVITLRCTLEPAQFLIDRGGRGKQLGARAQPHGQISAGHGDDRRHHPVEGTVGRAVLDVGRDRVPTADRVPQQLEDGAGHLGVTQDVVIGADEHVERIPADTLEHVVARRDDALGVGRGEEQIVVAQVTLEVTLSSLRLPRICVSVGLLTIRCVAHTRSIRRPSPRLDLLSRCATQWQPRSGERSRSPEREFCAKSRRVICVPGVCFPP